MSTENRTGDIKCYQKLTGATKFKYTYRISKTLSNVIQYHITIKVNIIVHYTDDKRQQPFLF